MERKAFSRSCVKIILLQEMEVSARTVTSYLVACGLTIAVLEVGCAPRPAAESPPAAEVKAVVEEIMSVGTFLRGAEPNHSLTRMVYARTSDHGNVLWEMDFADGGLKRLPRQEQCVRLFQWSPDDRHLLLKDFDNNDTLVSYDSSDGSFRPVMQTRSKKGNQVSWVSNPGQIAWVKPDAFAYVGNQDGTPELRVATLNGSERSLTTVSRRRAQHLLALLPENELAYVSQQELWAFNLGTLQVTQLTTNLSKDYLWLNYSKENRAFLYCSDDDSEWRHLYRLDLEPQGARKLTQLTFGPEHTYNGQWIQGGKGFAYVANLTNHYHLAVRPAETEAATNLFLGGYINTYRVAAEGNRIFAVASLGAEPWGIWEYDIAARRLRCLVPGAEPFKVSQIIPTTERMEKSFDGLEIQCFQLEPRNVQPGRKYPLVIAVPHEIGTFDWAWSKYPQFLANLGVHYVAVNVRGTDGHGRSFRENDPEQAYRDVLAVREAFVRSGNVDEKRIFLMAESSGSVLASKLTMEHAGMWGGVILIHPDLRIPQGEPNRALRYFAFTGEKDSNGELAAHARAFEKWAQVSGVEATMVYGENTWHDIVNTELDKRMGYALAEFIFQRKYTLTTTGQTQRDGRR